MPKGKKPTPAQVDLLLRLYELRRETKLRAARDWFAKNFFVEKPEDIERVAPMGSEENAYFRMVVTYWEMVCALLGYGLLHEDFFFETTGEQYMVWVRIQPVLGAWRQQFNDPKMLQHLEQIPLLDLNLRLGEGTGAALGISLVEAGVKILMEMATFADAGVAEKTEDEKVRG